MMETVSILTTALRRPQTYAGLAREAVSAARCAALYPRGVVEAALHTGTPAGVALGQPEPKPFLRAGDVVELEIEGLGRQRKELKDA